MDDHCIIIGKLMGAHFTNEIMLIIQSYPLLIKRNRENKMTWFFFSDIRALIQYKDVILPVQEILLWR